MIEKSPNAFRTISEVADTLEVPAHVLRFWESKFTQIKPVKRGGGRRYYRPTDVDLIRGIRDLLYTEGLTIKGVQKVLREKGVKHVMDAGLTETADWDEPEGDALEQLPQEELFEMAETAAPAPIKRKAQPKADAPPVSSDETLRELEELKKPEPDIRSLFDDPEPSDAAKAAIAEDELITKVARIAEGEKAAAPTAEATPVEAKQPEAGKSEIKSILSKLEALRDRMKNQ